MSTPAEHLRALKALPAAANAIIGASIRALHRPGAKRTALDLDLVRDLARAMRHYPMDSLVDAHWGETQARELREEISTLVERANEQYLEQADEIAALRDELDRTRREADTYLEERAEQDAEIAALRERVREVAEELSDSSVTFADPRVSYEEVQLTAGWRKEWLSRPEVMRALEEGGDE